MQRIPFATIKIYTSSDIPGSMSRQTDEKSNEYEILLNPDADKSTLEEVTKLNFSKDGVEKDVRESILAHELGHVVAQIYNDSSHDSRLNMIANLSGDERLKQPGEKIAWNLAHQITPILPEYGIKE